MQPTRAQYTVLARMVNRRDSHINQEHRIVGDRDQTPIKNELIGPMVEAGFLIHTITRAEDGAAVEGWALTRRGTLAVREAREQRERAERLKRDRGITHLGAPSIAVLAALCQFPKAVVLPNNSLRGVGSGGVPISSTLKLQLIDRGYLERAPVAYRLPIYRISTKGIEAYAEHLHADLHTRPVCVCGKAKSDHPDCGHVFADSRDVAILDYINLVLKERDHV